VGPRAGLDGCGKSRPPPGFDPRTLQPVATLPTVAARKLIVLLLIRVQFSASGCAKRGFLAFSVSPGINWDTSGFSDCDTWSTPILVQRLSRTYVGVLKIHVF
jgi:hypothetical protein